MTATIIDHVRSNDGIITRQRLDADTREPIGYPSYCVALPALVDPGIDPALWWWVKDDAGVLVCFRERGDAVAFV